MTKYDDLSWQMKVLYIVAIFFLFGAMGYMVSHGDVGRHSNGNAAGAAATQNQ